MYLYTMLYLSLNLFLVEKDLSGLAENLLLWTILTVCLSWISAAFIDALLPNSFAKSRVPPLPEPGCGTPPGPNLFRSQNLWNQADEPRRDLRDLAPHVPQGGLYVGCQPQVLDRYLTQEAARIKANIRTEAYRQETEIMDIVGVDVWRQAVELVVYQRHCNGPDSASNRAAIEMDLETTPVFEKGDIQNLYANHRHMCYCFRVCSSSGWRDSETSVGFFYDLWLLRFRFQYDTIQKFTSRPPPVALEVYKMRLVKDFAFGKVCWWYPKYICTDPGLVTCTYTPNRANATHPNLSVSTAIASHWFQDWINEKDNLKESIVFSPDSLLGFKLGCHFFASVKVSNRDYKADTIAQRRWHGFLKELDSEGIESVVEKYGISVCQEQNGVVQ